MCRLPDSPGMLRNLGGVSRPRHLGALEDEHTTTELGAWETPLLLLERLRQHRLFFRFQRVFLQIAPRIGVQQIPLASKWVALKDHPL